MLVLIDESGETGFKSGSSSHLIITMIVFADRTTDGRYPAAEHAARVVSDLLISLRHKPEFRFSACSGKVREAFFRRLAAANVDFAVYAMVADKAKITSPHLRKNGKDFYNFFLKQLLVKNPIHNAVVKIDGQKSCQFRRALASYLRQGRSGMLEKLKFCDSKSDMLIQLADMACGAVAHQVNRTDRMGSDLYVKLLGQRIKNIWMFQ